MRNAADVFTEFAKQAIAEYSNDCQFCLGKADLYHDDSITLHISKALGCLEILADSPNYLPINYCPICGKKIEKRGE